jgi:hypothetical protein
MNVLTCSTHPQCSQDGICLRYHLIGIIATLLLLALPKTTESPHHCRGILGYNSAAPGTNVWMTPGGCIFFYQIHFAFEGCEVCCGPIHACNPDLVKNNEHTMHLYFFDEKCKLYGYSCLTRGVDLLTLPRFPRASGLFLLQTTRGRLGLKTF